MFIFLQVLLYSQVPSSLPVSLISKPNGLEETDNRFIYKDSKGCTWISSIQGLYCYRGSVLRHYSSNPLDSTSLNGNIVNGLFFEDKHTNIWFSTYDAINCYIRSKDEFRSYRIPSTDAPGYFTGGLDSIGQLWFIWDSLLMTFHIRDHQFKKISQIAGDASRLIVTLDNAGLVKTAYTYNTERSSPGFEKIDFSEGAPFRSRIFYKIIDEYPLVVRNLCMDNDTSLWIASHYGLIHINPETGDSSIYSPLPKTERIFFNHVIQLNDSMLFLVSYNRGTFTFNKRKYTFRHHFDVTFKEEIIQEPLQTLYKDDHGGVWISITGLGVAYFHPNNLRLSFFGHHLDPPQSALGIDPNHFIELKDDTVFVTSDLHGAFLFKGPDQILTHYERDVIAGWIANNTHQSYLDRQGRIWILTASGPIIRYPDDEVIPLIADSIFYANSINQTDRGDIILGLSSGGLYRCVEAGPKQFKLQEFTGTDKSKVYSYLYFHTDQRLYGAANLTSLDIYSTDKGLHLVKSMSLNAYAHCMVSGHDGGEIWIGTNEGIYIYDAKSEILYQPEWLTFLAKIIVYGIVPVDGQVLWISSNNGLFKLNLLSKSYQRFHTGHGTGTLTFNSNSFLHRANGQIWFGSQHGITVVDANMEMTNVRGPDLHIQKILINDNEPSGLICSKSGASNVTEFEAINLPFSNNTLSFVFSAFEYTGPDHIMYEYRMTGIDTAWVPSEDRGFARYANLDPGHYTFEARAGNGTPGVYSPVRTLAIYIIPPLYRKPWFITFLVIIAGSLLFWIYYLNERRKEKVRQLVFDKKLALETERLRIANDMHDDLGSGISALGLRTKLLSENVEGPELQKQLSELAHQTGKLSEQVRETIWTINSKNDTIDGLITRLHQLAHEYFEGAGIQCRVVLMPELMTNAIPGNHRRELYLSFKEALHNIVKHAKATQVMITMEMNNYQKLTIEIIDNGVGFDPEAKNSGLGINSMKKRIEGIGGEFILDTGQDGTSIKFVYPV